MITDQLNRVCSEHIANDRVAQGPQLRLAFHAVAARIMRLRVTRVAAQLRDALLDFRFEHSPEALDTDLLEMGLAAPLPIEL